MPDEKKIKQRQKGRNIEEGIAEIEIYRGAGHVVNYQSKGVEDLLLLLQEKICKGDMVRGRIKGTS